MCRLTVVNKAREVVAEGVGPETFMSFKKVHGKGSAVVVELHCGEEIFVDTENPTSSSKRCSLQSTPAETRGAATARLRFVGISRVGRGLIQRGHIRQASAETRNL